MPLFIIRITINYQILLLQEGGKQARSICFPPT